MGGAKPVQTEIQTMANIERTKLEASSASPHPVAVKLRRILVSVYLETSAAIDYALELARLRGFAVQKIIFVT